jgi:hypothetical protein
MTNETMTSETWMEPYNEIDESKLPAWREEYIAGHMEGLAEHTMVELMQLIDRAPPGCDAWHAARRLLPGRLDPAAARAEIIGEVSAADGCHRSCWSRQSR